MKPIPDLTGWQAYCDDCRLFREVVRVRDWDVTTHEEYFDFICHECQNIVLTIRRTNPAERLTESPLVRQVRTEPEFRLSTARAIVANAPFT
jgi:hypothetical protein